jgi:putative nucleotidyltransferase with HDIG domain
MEIQTAPALGIWRTLTGLRLHAYAAAMSFSAGLLAVSLLAAGYHARPWAAIAALSVLSAIGERGRVHLTANLELSISTLPALFAAVAFGPLPAMIVGAASMLTDAPVGRGSRYPSSGLRWAIYSSSEAITGAVTGLAAAAATGLVSAGYAGVILATVVGATTAQVFDVAFAALTFHVRGTGNALDLIRASMPVTVASVPLYVPLVALLVITYRSVSPWTLPLFLVPTLAAQRLFALYQEQRKLTEQVVAANERLESANLSFATALVATLDARDQYTAGHSAAVAIYARDIAERMGLSEEEQQLAHLAGLVHDVGKIGLPAGLLEKPGALSLDERRQMEQHSAIGERILRNVDDYGEIAAIVRHHHERVDGLGYPDRLSGDTIPLVARIIAVADAYNAMTSDRPYRDAMPSRVARLRLAQAVDSHFDIRVVAAFEAVLASADESYRMGVGHCFALAEPTHETAVPLALRSLAAAVTS